MDKKQVRKSRKIDMGHFLRDYYGVDNDKLISESFVFCLTEILKRLPHFMELI